jgi:hypothetical protein
MKKIVIAYHAYMYKTHWMEMMVEQCRLLITTGLYQAADKLYIGVIESTDRDPKHGREWLGNFWKASSSKEEAKTPSKVEIVFYPDNKEEANTMKWVRDYAKKNPGDYVLYFHTKGISKYSLATEDWRRYMEYFNIENWRDCVQKLNEGYDCCGVMWNSHTPIGTHPHFSGTFWWASTDYINTLNPEYLELEWRFYREFWIGSAPKVKAFEFHNSHLNDKDALTANKSHYNLLYPRKMYEKKNKKIHVICTVFQRFLPLTRLVYDWLLQTDRNWDFHIVHDGPAPQEIKMLVDSLNDSRITFESTTTINGLWGFPNRKRAIQELKGDDKDFILITNDDNQYMPVFVEYFLKECKPDVGMVYGNTIHNYMKYEILQTQIRECYIDMGSFIVRFDVAKHVGMNHQHEQADGKYAEECAAECKKRNLRIAQINKALYVHN